MNERDLLQAGFRYALSLRASHQDAEDLVQEAWFRLHRHQGRVSGKSQLFTTIRNLFIDRYRRSRLAVFEPMDEIDEPIDEEAAKLEAHIVARDLEAPLESLRPEEREALFLMVVEGYTADEVAGLTGRARGTVLSMVYRAKRKLRKALDDPQFRDAVATGSGGAQR